MLRRLRFTFPVVAPTLVVLFTAAFITRHSAFTQRWTQHPQIHSGQHSEQDWVLPPSSFSVDSIGSTQAGSMFSSFASRDLQQYLSGYPGHKDNPLLNENLLFYSNQLSSRPDGDYIDVIHTQWWGDYETLERHHGYIQWLFPIREAGMNMLIHPLQLHEMQQIRHQYTHRVIKSYQLILDFYGFKLIDKETGELMHTSQYTQRIHNLVHSTHNYLRVTRILKSLGELGFENLKLGWLLLLYVACEMKGTAYMRRSAAEYWYPVLRDAADRRALEQVINKRVPMNGFKQYKEILQKRAIERQEEQEQQQQRQQQQIEKDRQEDEEEQKAPEDDYDEYATPSARHPHVLPVIDSSMSVDIQAEAQLHVREEMTDGREETQTKVQNGMQQESKDESPVRDSSSESVSQPDLPHPQPAAQPPPSLTDEVHGNNHNGDKLRSRSKITDYFSAVPPKNI